MNFAKWLYNILHGLKPVHPEKNHLVERLKSIKERYLQKSYIKEEMQESRKKIYTCFNESEWSKVLLSLQKSNFDIFEEHFYPQDINKKELFQYFWNHLGIKKIKIFS